MNYRPKILLVVVSDTIRRKHYSHRTEKSYLQWIKRYVIFHHKRHPREMGKDEVEAFLTYLAVEGKVAASTQNQAFNAILFLYRQVLDQPPRKRSSLPSQADDLPPRRSYPSRSSLGHRPNKRSPSLNYSTPLWNRNAPDRSPFLANQRHRPQPTSDHYSQRKRHERPHHYASRQPYPRPKSTPRPHPTFPSTRSQRRLRFRMDALRPRS